MSIWLIILPETVIAYRISPSVLRMFQFGFIIFRAYEEKGLTVPLNHEFGIKRLLFYVENFNSHFSGFGFHFCSKRLPQKTFLSLFSFFLLSPQVGSNCSSNLIPVISSG